MTRTPAIPRGSLLSEVDKKLNSGNFKSFGHFAKSLAYQRHSPQAKAAIDDWNEVLSLKAPQGLYGDSDPDGGVLIPPQFSLAIYERMGDLNAILPFLNPIQIQGRTYEWPVLKEDSRAAGSRQGGTLAYWEDEAQQHTKSKPTFRNIQLRLKKLTAFIYATDEVLSDAPALEGWLPTVAAKELAFQTNAAVISGLGAGRPLGILNSGSKVTVAAVSGQGASTIVEQNILDMYARIPAPMRSSLVWLANQDAEKSLMRLFTATGQSAASAMLQPDPSRRGGFLLMNAPLLTIEQCSTLGTEGDIIAFATDGYACVTKGTPDTQMSMHLRFDYDEYVYKIRVRIDGQPKDDVALTPYLGSNAQSAIVTLNSTRT